MGWRVWAICLMTVGTSGCSILMQLARSEAEELAGETGRAPKPTVPATAGPTSLDASGLPGDPTVVRDPVRARLSNDRSASGTKSTYESTPMMGVSTASFAHPFSLMGSLFPRPGTTPGCRVGAQEWTDVLYAPAGPPVDASEPLGLRVGRHGAPVRQFVTLGDARLRSARAFRSGAVLSGEGAVCGRSFAHYYVELSFGWSPTPPVAVSR